MSDLYVKKGFRGMGIASAFKKEAFRWFRKKGVKYASIMFFVGNERAHKIYNKWGFFDFHMEMRAPIA